MHILEEINTNSNRGYVEDMIIDNELEAIMYLKNNPDVYIRTMSGYDCNRVCKLMFKVIDECVIEIQLESISKEVCSNLNLKGIIGNKGQVNMHEFSVGMQLIDREDFTNDNINQ
jgi:hypothetical protein